MARRRSIQVYDGDGDQRLPKPVEETKRVRVEIKVNCDHVQPSPRSPHHGKYGKKFQRIIITFKDNTAMRDAYRRMAAVEGLLVALYTSLIVQKSTPAFATVRQFKGVMGNARQMVDDPNKLIVDVVND